MQTLETIRKRQTQFIEEQLGVAEQLIEEYIKPNPRIRSCLISGSVARGSYMPGEKGGAIDLIIFVDNLSDFDADDALGPDIEEHIPGHFIQAFGSYFQIKIYDRTYIENFTRQAEAEKFAFFESRVLYDESRSLADDIEKLRAEVADEEISTLLVRSLRYMKYLIGSYKVDRWQRRGAVVQLNKNLCRSFDIAVNCLFYINNLYAPAEDRALYFSYELEKKPDSYERLVEDMTVTRDLTLQGYREKETLFRERMIAFIEKHVRERG
jgi:hypothetical protein